MQLNKAKSNSLLGVKITPGRPEINFVPSQLCAVYSLELDQKPGIKLHLRRHSLCFISFSARLLQNSSKIVFTLQVKLYIFLSQ